MKVSIELNGKNVEMTVEVKRYNSGGIALIVSENGEERGIITKDIYTSKYTRKGEHRKSTLKDNEVCIRNWTSHYIGHGEYMPRLWVWMDRVIEKLSNVMTPTGVEIDLEIAKGKIYKLSDELLKYETKS